MFVDLLKIKFSADTAMAKYVIDNFTRNDKNWWTSRCLISNRTISQLIKAKTIGDLEVIQQKLKSNVKMTKTLVENGLSQNIAKNLSKGES